MDAGSNSSQSDERQDALSDATVVYSESKETPGAVVDMSDPSQAPTAPLSEFDDIPIEDLTFDALVERNRVQSTWLRMALFQTDDVFWAYDLKTHDFVTFFYDAAGVIRTQKFKNFPQSYIERGRVHVDSIPAFRNLFEHMGSGPAEGQGNFVLTDRITGFFVWAVASYRLMLDSNGHARYAVGVRRNHAKQGMNASDETTHDPIPETVMPNLYCYLQANLRTNTVDYLLYRGAEQAQNTHRISYTEMLAKAHAMLFDRTAPSKVVDFDREHLISAYRAGKRWIARRTRLVDSTGTIWRLLVSANLRTGSESGMPTAYIFLSNLAKRHQWEADSALTPSIDEDTGIYSEATALAMIQAIAHSGIGNVPCALTVYSLRGLDDVRSKDEKAAKRVRTDIAIGLNALLDTSAIVWSVDDHTLASIQQHATSGAAVQAKLESALLSLRMSLSGSSCADDIHVVAATICGGVSEIDFAQAVDRARTLAESNTSIVEDTVLMPQNHDVDLEPRQADRNIFFERFEQKLSDMEWTREDAQFYADCLAGMISASNYGAAITEALRKIGHHYDVDRVYIMSLSDSDNTVSVLFEWAREGRSSILQRFSKRTIDHFPLIKRHIETSDPVLVSKPGMRIRSDTDDVSAPWRFGIVPMINTPEQHMVLCFENPRAHIFAWAPACKIAQSLVAEWKKLASESSHETPSIIVDQTPNAQGFRKAASAYTSDRYSSLGVLTVDIRDISEVVSKHGFAASVDAVRTIEQAVDGAFDPELIFRTGDAEIIALCPDTVYEAFIKRCARVRSMLTCKHPGMFRIGSAWSDNVFSALKLAREAHMMLVRDNEQRASNIALENASIANEPAGAKTRFAENPVPAARGEGFEDELDGSFDVFLQPKIDARTGELLGAEALARMYDNAGEAHTPVAAIERMEQDGSICKLDYFVLNRTLQLMDRWRQQGFRVLPISSNFSRSTLLAPTALASVLAIMSHFPHINPELVEMEITETACDLGSSTITNLVDMFRSNGLRVALDDFGSSYSTASILSDVQFDTIKIDRTLVNGLPSNDVSRKLVRSIAEICDAHHMECVAEGIETKEQANALIEEGCYSCQGFYYDKPLPANLFEQKYLTGTDANRRLAQR